MKQNISQQRIDDLSWPEKYRLGNWLLGKGYISELTIGAEETFNIPLLTIGQLIHFISDHTDFGMYKQYNASSANRMWAIRKTGIRENKYPHKELIDTLWFMTREILTSK